MAPNPESTRRELINAAEVLFAARGIEAVSLREINAAAGQRNATALQYHFGDRHGLVRAVIEKHRPAVEAARHSLLDEYEAAGVDDLRLVAGALVRPSAAKLAGGFRTPAGDSVDRWRRLVGPLLPDVAVRRLHHRFTAIRVTATELARRAAATPRRDDELFTSHLVDLVTALLAAPLSAETEALLLARQRPSG
jgi:AcrR family transcriptional regulator